MALSLLALALSIPSSFQWYWTMYSSVTMPCSFFPRGPCVYFSLSPECTSYTYAHPNHRHLASPTPMLRPSFAAASFWNSSHTALKTGLRGTHHTLIHFYVSMTSLKDPGSKNCILFATFPLLHTLPSPSTEHTDLLWVLSTYIFATWMARRA